MVTHTALSQFVGVCGVQTHEAALSLHTHWRMRRASASCRLMVGALAFSPRLSGTLREPIWSRRCPPEGARGTLFSGLQGDLCCVHYLGDGQRLEEEMCTVVDEFTGCNAIQLNMPTPDWAQVQGFRNKCPRFVVGWRIGSADEDFDNVVEGLLHVDYVLIDRSEGRGIPIDLGRATKAIQVLVGLRPDLRVAVAGGLDANGVRLMLPLLRRWPSISWDAEGRLRGRLGLHLDRARAYLDESVTLIANVGLLQPSTGGLV